MRNLLSELLGERGPPRFSLAALAASCPELAARFLWKDNSLPAALGQPLWLHLGCGENVLEGFVNLDFLPHDARVAAWDLLQPWPARWPMEARGAFSEDTLEHFFLAEQLYILCEMNRTLAPGAIFRVLMPALDRLIAYCHDFRPRPGEFLHETFGVETRADAINAGMRFSGHRWLHDDESLTHLAREAGFEPIKTSCATSTEPHLSGRNLRVEEGTAAFAYDLRKVKPMERWTLEPSSREGMERIETLPGGIDVLRLRSSAPELRFALPRPLEVSGIACVNVRSANLTSFREHSLKNYVLRGSFGEGRWALDETLKSHPTMNLATRSCLRIAAGGSDRLIEEIALVPGVEGDVVTAGMLEIFLRETADSPR